VALRLATVRALHHVFLELELELELELVEGILAR
jgi:hypothetical protein